MIQETDLLEYLTDLHAADLEIRHRAEDALVKEGSRAVQALIQFLSEEKDTEPKWYAARALARIGEPAVIPLLDALAEESRDEVRRYLAAALAEMKNAPVEEIISLLGSEDPELRRYGTMILCRIGGPAVGALKKAMREDEGILGRCAQYTLLRIGIEPREGPPGRP
ncbi:MAG: HEAT repeat domain-containing protein [Methanomicrobiales archaeon]|nr:HEAT repeat domain-containing protein [Methanomicrobiales archaeon]